MRMTYYFIFAIFFIVFAVPVSAASLSLQADSVKVTIGKEQSVALVLDTEEKETVGTDIVLTYDASKLKLKDVVEGITYSHYVKEINDKEGKVMISGVIDPDKKLFKGKGVFATLKFEAVKEGKADIQIEFSEGSRNDSNVADRSGNDILTHVEHHEIQIVGKGYDNNFFEMIRKFFERLKQNHGKPVRR